MKITIEYQMPDDNIDYKLSEQAGSMYQVLIDLRDELRTMCKHGRAHKIDIEWRDRLYALLQEHEVKTDF